MKTATANTSTETQTFIMPASVATALLSDPRNKMTSKMRKRAKTARETGIVSSRTIILKNGIYDYAEDRSRTGSEKLQGRLKGRKFRQLLKWERRIAARIKILNRVVETLDAVTESTIADALRARIAQMHAIGSLIQEELDTRG